MVRNSTCPATKDRHGIGAVQQGVGNGIVPVGGDAENDLQEDENAEGRHGKKQRVPTNGQFAFDPLFAEPEKREQRGAGFEDESGPGLDGAEGERTEHQQSKCSIEQDGVHLRWTIRVRCFAVNKHQEPVRFPRTCVAYDGFLVSRKSSIQSLPRMGLRSGSRRMCSTTNLQSGLVVNSPSADFQKPASFNSSLS